MAMAPGIQTGDGGAFDMYVLNIPWWKSKLISIKEVIRKITLIYFVVLLCIFSGNCQIRFIMS